MLGLGIMMLKKFSSAGCRQNYILYFIFRTIFKGMANNNESDLKLFHRTCA